jgi:large subunit ribosomal protein L21
MEAVVKISGKQYRVAEGQRVTVDRLASPVGEEVTFGDVLLLTDGVKSTIGTPTVDGASVKARVVGTPRGPKVLVYKYKPKKRYRRTHGQRAAVSVLEVLAVSAGGGAKQRAKAEPTAPASRTKADAAPKARAPKTAPAKKAEES